MIEWLREKFPPGSNYLILQENHEEINAFVFRQLVFPLKGRHRNTLWGKFARQLSHTGSKLGWVPNKLPGVFLNDTVEAEIADAIASRQNQLKPNNEHFVRARDLLAQLHLTHLAKRNPFFLSEGETKLIWFFTQWAKQPEYLIIGHLPTALSDFRTAQLMKFILDSEQYKSRSFTLLLGYHAAQIAWCAQLMNDEQWEKISRWRK